MFVFLAVGMQFVGIQEALPDALGRFTAEGESFRRLSLRSDVPEPDRASPGTAAWWPPCPGHVTTG